MLNLFSQMLRDWHATKNERQKLQYGLLFLSFAIILIAGIVSLFDASLSHSIVLIALFTLAGFVANGLVWNLLDAFVLSKLSTKPRRK